MVLGVPIPKSCRTIYTIQPVPKTGQTFYFNAQLVHTITLK